MPTYDFKRMNRTMMIYRIVQTILVALLVYMAINFQSMFSRLGHPEFFLNSIKFTIIAQLLLFYPVNRLANRDVGVEIEGSQVGLAADQLAALRKKRLMGDLWKFCGVGFFLAFVVMVPDAGKATGMSVILAATIFSFLLTCLMYFQSYNFCAKKRIRENA